MQREKDPISLQKTHSVVSQPGAGLDAGGQRKVGGGGAMFESPIDGVTA
jgi:hypothetical protein